MNKGIIIAIVALIILSGIALTIIPQSSDESIMIEEPVVEIDENEPESTGKSIQINLNDGIGAGDR